MKYLERIRTTVPITEWHHSGEEGADAIILVPAGAKGLIIDVFGGWEDTGVVYLVDVETPDGLIEEVWLIGDEFELLEDGDE